MRILDVNITGFPFKMLKRMLRSRGGRATFVLKVATHTHTIKRVACGFVYICGGAAKKLTKKKRFLYKQKNTRTRYIENEITDLLDLY